VHVKAATSRGNLESAAKSIKDTLIKHSTHSSLAQQSSANHYAINLLQKPISSRRERAEARVVLEHFNFVRAKGDFSFSSLSAQRAGGETKLNQPQRTSCWKKI
jgi:hypothetical protein